MTDLAGQFAVTQIGGWTGFEIGFGQRMVRPKSPNAARYARRFSHALIALDDGTCLEAEPGGARIVPIGKYTTGPLAEVTRWSDMQLTDEHKRRIGVAGRALEGRPYSFLNYPAIALEHEGARPEWLTDFISSTGHVICSQAVDLTLFNAGLHLFDDGRLFMDVLPLDLADWQDKNPHWVPVIDAA